MALRNIYTAAARWLLLVVAFEPQAYSHTTTTQTLSVDALQNQPRNPGSFSEWLDRQSEVSKQRLLENIGPRGAHPGAVVAAPSRRDPDYFYHWVRDAALVMDTVLSMYEATDDPRERNDLERILFDYLSLSRQHQTVLTPSGDRGLGEPKFNADGSVFWGPWGRPQNDGPALRAVTLVRFAEILLDQGRSDLVYEKLYRPEIPATTAIKADLEFVSHHWREHSFDLWEEIKGHHFYTQMVQRRALIEGARLARRLGDHHAADWYEQQIPQISVELEKYWNRDSEIIVATRHRVDGINYKHSGLDSAVILAVLHGYAGDGFFGPSDPRVLATAAKMERAFRDLYPINRAAGFPGTAIGRYPEDRYTGYHSDGEGNPWVLNTNAFAELYYRAARSKLKLGAYSAATKLIDHGDSFLARVQYHANPDGSLSEQINRYSGHMQGAPNLTWSHASFLTALWARP